MWIVHLPIRVRPASFEDAESFAHRVRDANGIDVKTWRAAIRNNYADFDVDPTIAAEHWLEAAAGLRPGHFQFQRDNLPAHADGSRCRQCVTGLEHRIACTRCTRGEVAVLIAHDGPRVCRRHRRWIGSGSLPAEQHPASAEILRADVRYQSLRAQGQIDAHRLTLLEDCVVRSRSIDRRALREQAERYRLAVGLAEAVARLTATLSHGASRAEALLARGIEDLLPDADGPGLLARVLLLIESTGRSGISAHGFTFERPITSPSPSPSPPPRSALTSSFTCTLGHIYRSTFARSESPRVTTGCPYCENRRLLPGFNALTDTHPTLATEFDRERNGELDPSQVLSGSGRAVWWRCQSGHVWSASPATRTRGGSGCSVCANRSIDPRYNSLTTTHESIAGEWHPTLNAGLSPIDVVAGSGKHVWWMCPHGHTYTSQILARAAGANCPHCDRRVAHPQTSLSATHPEVAALWHPELNGDLRPDRVLAGSSRRVWWTCALGHAYTATINNRTRTKTCPSCRASTTLDRKTLAHARPHLAAEFDLERNHPLDPCSVSARSSLRVWWRCRMGHSWQTACATRSRGKGGCPVCRRGSAPPDQLSPTCKGPSPITGPRAVSSAGTRTGTARCGTS